MSRFVDTSASISVVEDTELDDMSSVFPVDENKRGVIWANGVKSAEADAERETGLKMFVDFYDVVATQNFVEWDVVNKYMEDPTAKGFEPTVYDFEDGKFYLQDGHHRAVASKQSGNKGMTMVVIKQEGYSDA